MHADRFLRPSAALLILGIACFAAALGMLAMPLPAAAQTEPTPLPLYALPDPRSELLDFQQYAGALAPDNRTLVAANMLNNSISIVRPGGWR